jgi:hypothetical protein
MSPSSISYNLQCYFISEDSNVRTSLRPNVDHPCVIGTCSSWHICDDIYHSSPTSRINFKLRIHSDPTRLHRYSSIDSNTNTHHSIHHQQPCLSSAQPVSASSRPLAPRPCAPNAPRSPSSPVQWQPQTTALARVTPRVRTPKTRAPTLPPTWSTPAHHHPRRVRAVARVPPRAVRRRPTPANLLSSLKVRKKPTSPSRRSQTNKVSSEEAEKDKVGKDFWKGKCSCSVCLTAESRTVAYHEQAANKF